MSFLDKARRRLSESGMGRRGSLPGSGGTSVTGMSPVIPSPLAAAMSKNEMNTSNISLSGRWDNGPIIEQEKTDPSQYLFLIRTDPLLDWEESNTLEVNELDPFDGLSIELKVYHNRTRDNNSVCRILSKFADESIDDYLFEIGILTEVLPKFDDYINEIEALRECRNHRNILDFYDAYYYDSKLWIFTEYCTFGSLEKLLHDLNRPLNMMQIHYVVKEVLFGLDFLHNRLKICHRDMQCASLFIGDDLSIKIANFTLSAKVNASKDKVVLPPKAPHFIQMEVLKRGYYFVRSPHYASPEEVRSYSNQYDNPKSDIWGFGITCIAMAEQFPPLKSLSAEAVIQAINDENFKPTLKEADKWDASFVDFLSKCLNRNVDLRASVKELIEHEFITKFKSQSSKSDIQQALADRKKALFAESQRILANLDQTVQSLRLVEEQPEKFIQNYFDSLRGAIDAKAREAAEKIERDRANMIEMMNQYQAMCVSDLNKKKFQPFSESIEEIISDAKDNLNKWNQSLSKSDLNEQELNKTNTDSSNFIKETQTELNKIKLQLFGGQVYQLQPTDKETIKFAELVALNTKDLLGEDSVHNVNNYEKAHRPINKLIRFDLKGTKRK